MSSSVKILISLLIGLMAGAVAWRLPVVGSTYGGTLDNAERLPHDILFGFALGLGLGLVNAWASDARVEKGLSLGLGTACGAVGALLGSALATPITNSIAHTMHGLSEAAQFVLLTLGQASGWGVFGLILGAGIGAAGRSPRLAWQGALGGLLGGLLGGIAQGTLLQNGRGPFWGAPFSAGEHWRQMLGLTALGGLIGLGTALAPWLGRQSWVCVREGGREYALARLLVRVGRDRACDIVLRGDTRVAPVHATIEAMPGGRHHLTVTAGMAGQFAPVAINERLVIGEQWLADGDMLQIGRHLLAFRERVSSGAMRLEAPQTQTWIRALRPRAKSFSIQTFSPAMPLPVDPLPPAPVLPSNPIPTLDPLPLLGLRSDMAALSLDEPLPSKDPNVPLSALPALLEGIVLRAEQGPYVGRAFVVDAVIVTNIGRAIERELPLPMDKAVSRLHARIVPRNDDYLLEDAGSANGTFVNGLRLTGRRTLHPGDLIQVGATFLRCT